MKLVKAPGISRSSADLINILFDKAQQFSGAVTERGQAAFVNLFIASSFRDFVRPCFATAGQMVEGRDQALKLQQLWILRTQRAFQAFNPVDENARIFLGIDGEAMLVIKNAEFALFRVELQLEFAAVKDSAVLIAQDRHQDFELQFVLQRFPVNIEKLGVGGSLSVLQNIQPPGVVSSHDTHVVRNHIEDLAHAVRAQRADKGVEVLDSSDFRIEYIVIDDVVAMHASRASPEVRGRIAMGNAKLSQVGDQLRCLLKSEIAIELQPVGCQRNAGRVHG